MITNQLMIRESGFVQRTKDGYFSANQLLELWNANNSNKKILGNFSKLNETKDFIEQLKKEGVENPLIAGRGTGDSAGTWMHPKLFIDLAMWISVEFKSKVIDMVLDGLIISRNDAGDYYNEMCACIMENYLKVHECKPPATLYINEANLIKELLDVNYKDRNEMTQKELDNITLLQKVNSELISNNVGIESRRRHLGLVANSLKRNKR